MTMVGRHDGLLDASSSKLTDGSRQVIYDRIHNLPGLERKARLAGAVDLLRANHDDAGLLDLSGKLRRLQAQELVERDINQPRHARGGEFLTGRKVGKKRSINARTECATLHDDVEAGGGARLKSRHSNGCDAR